MWTYNPNFETRAWVFTLNNYTPADIEIIQALRYQYVVYGQETATSGTPHLQGYIYAKNKIAASTLKNKHSTWHFEPSRASDPSDAYDYCKKGEQSHEEWVRDKQEGPNYGLNAKVWERGTPPKPGRRTDVERARELIAAGAGRKELLRECQSLQTFRMAELVLADEEPPRDFKPEIFWLFGKTGQGKTSTAKKMSTPTDLYWVPDPKWWPLYDGHPDCIIDELRYGWLPFSKILRLLDENPYQVEYKGGFRQFRSKRIFITCPNPPDVEFAAEVEDTHQLLRRIDHIWRIHNFEIAERIKG